MAPPWKQVNRVRARKFCTGCEDSWVFEDRIGKSAFY